MKSRYYKGRRFEYKVKQRLEKKGYLVFRLAGSKPFDLIALKKGEVVFVECKTHKRIPTSTLNKLREMAVRVGARAKIITPNEEMDLV